MQEGPGTPSRPMDNTNHFPMLLLSITLESASVALNCMVLVVLGYAVSQGPTRGNLQIADSQAKKKKKDCAVTFGFAADFLKKVVWGCIFPQNFHT